MASLLKFLPRHTPVCSLLVRNTAKPIAYRYLATKTATQGKSNSGQATGQQQELTDLQKYWDNFAEIYTNYQSRVTSVIQHSVIINLQLANAKRVLEVGAGSGNSTQLLLRELDTTNTSSAECKFVTSDYSPDMVKRLGAAVEQLTKKLEKPPSDIDVRQIDIRKLPFEDGSFDRYFAGLCIHLVPEYETCMKEAARVLTRGGIAGFSIWGREERHTFVSTTKQIVKDVCGKDLPPQPVVHSNFELARDPRRFMDMLKKAGFSRVVHWYQPACAFTGFDRDRKSLMMPLGFITVKELLDSLPENIRQDRTEQVEQRLMERFAKDGLDNRQEPLIFECLCAIAVK